MMNRLSIAFLIVGAVAGYFIAGTSVKAQADPLPFAIGETVILRYSTGAHPSESHPWVECAVMEIRGGYVRCAPPAVRPGRPAVELWRSLQSVAMIQKD